MHTHSYTSALRETKSFAFYGLKRNGTGFAHEIASGLRKFNPACAITAVRPDLEKVPEFPVVSSISAVSPTPEMAIVVLKSDEADQPIMDIRNSEVRQVWLVQNAASDKNINALSGHSCRVYSGCPLLYMPGNGFPHNLHRWLARVFNKL